MNRSFRFTISILLFFSAAGIGNLPAQEVYQCVWRNPERTMTRLFPGAKDYKTLTKRISESQLRAIEEKAGALLPGQKQAFQYFEMLSSGGTVIGYTLAATQKGEYGAIEFVFGLNAHRIITGIYIQRARERDGEFKKADFLNQFIGKSIADIERMKTRAGITGKKTAGTSAVIAGIVKELVALDVLAR